MKLAIQLSGHLRTFINTAQSFNNNLISPNLVKGHEIDVFIHTWNKTDHDEVVHHNPTGEIRSNHVSQKIIDSLITLYKPTSFFYEPQLKITSKEEFVKFNGNINNLQTIKNVFYTKLRVNQLRNKHENEKNIAYDYVISSRCDIEYITQFLIDDYLKIYNDIEFLKKFSPPKNAIFYSANFRNQKTEDHRILSASDIFSFTTPDVANQQSQIFNQLNCEDLQKNFLSFEYFNYYFGKKNNIDFIRIAYDMNKDWKIYRANSIMEKQTTKKEKSFFKN